MEHVLLYLTNMELQKSLRSDFCIPICRFIVCILEIKQQNIQRGTLKTPQRFKRYGDRNY